MDTLKNNLKNELKKELKINSLNTLNAFNALDSLNDWTDINTESNYNIKCEKCGNTISIRQYGCELNQIILEEILTVAHKNNSYDSLQKYYLDVLINVDIVNKNCIK